MTTRLFYLITKSDCIFCDRAKELIEANGDRYQAYPYTDHVTIKFLMRYGSLKTVPQIWTGEGAYVGGYDDLVAYYKTNEVKD